MAFGERDKGIKNSVRIWGRGSARVRKRPVVTGLRRLCLDGSAFDRDREFAGPRPLSYKSAAARRGGTSSRLESTAVEENRLPFYQQCYKVYI